MTPGAQIAASIDVLEMLQQAWDDGKAMPVDGLLGDYFRKRRFIGAKDKGFISRRVYKVLRKGGSLQWWAERHSLPITPRAMVLGALVAEENLPLDILKGYFTGEKYDPPKLSQHEISAIKSGAGNQNGIPEWMRLNVPEWSLAKLREIFGENLEAEIMALSEEAPLDLRVNTLKTTREEAMERLRQEGFNAKKTPMSPWGLRLEKRGALFATRIFKAGLVEIQDEGSQLTALLVDAKPGQKVIDFCAGAGGKTLALAAAMQNKGRILAWDVSAHRMDQMPKRLSRAGVDNVQRHALTSEQDQFIKRHKDSADRVLVDAPCTGSGTWRRNPDLKWRSTETALSEMQAIQQNILKSAARLVKPGGRLIYVTCSLYSEENELQVKKFLAGTSGFRLVSPAEIWNNDYSLWQSNTSPYLRLTPHQFGTDGFFTAVMEKATTN